MVSICGTTSSYAVKHLLSAEDDLYTLIRAVPHMHFQPSYYPRNGIANADACVRVQNDHHADGLH